MKVQLLRSITSINRALPAGNKLASTRRNEIVGALGRYSTNFSLGAIELANTCGIRELGDFEDFENIEDTQVAILATLLCKEDVTLDTTTSPISLEFPYGLIFTIIDDVNGRNIRDAILGILPFKLIGKGVSTKTSNPLETYGLFPMPEEN